MGKRDEMKLPTWNPRMPTMRAALEKSQHRPRIRYTQGGSSRRSRGARVAARDATTRS